ncbi:MAG: hypothetical protein L0207_01610 [Chlamydiae bacterium]|nr:hypothetical protein [Chlamydiota bacterium]
MFVRPTTTSFLDRLFGEDCIKPFAKLGKASIVTLQMHGYLQKDEWNKNSKIFSMINLFFFIPKLKENTNKVVECAESLIDQKHKFSTKNVKELLIKIGSWVGSFSDGVDFLEGMHINLLSEKTIRWIHIIDYGCLSFGMADQVWNNGWNYLEGRRKLEGLSNEAIGKKTSHQKTQTEMTRDLFKIIESISLFALGILYLIKETTTRFNQDTLKFWAVHAFAVYAFTNFIHFVHDAKYPPDSKSSKAFSRLNIGEDD